MSKTPEPPEHDFADSALATGLHSRSRRLIELRMEHAELNAQIDALCATPGFDQLLLKRLKKKRLLLKDSIQRFEDETEPLDWA
jgi:hypothetical protein